jgi:hypothetical protein
VLDAWLKEFVEEVSSGAQVLEFNNQFRALKKQGVKKPEALISAVWVNVAISFAGLKALNVSPPDLASFPPSFQNGMAKANIGDVGASDPAKHRPFCHDRGRRVLSCAFD